MHVTSRRSRTGLARQVPVLVVLLLAASACTTRNPLAGGGDASVDTTWDGEPAPDRILLPPDFQLDFERPPRPDVLPFPDVDRPAPDLTPPPAQSCAQVAGRPCSSSSQCGGHVCAITDPIHQRGVCGCSCTADDLSTPLVNEDSCPNLSALTCGSVRGGDGQGQVVNICMRQCKPALHATNPCPPGTACDPRSSRFSTRVDRAFCATAACKSDNDCLTQTTQRCTTSGSGGTSAGCVAGASCEPFVAGSKQGRCVRPGRCDTRSGLCLPRLSSGTQHVGAPCKADPDCPASGHCELPVDNALLRKPFGALCSDDSQCCGGRCDSGRCAQGSCAEHSRNGYCVIDGCNFLPEFACTGASTCVLSYPGGRCLATCKPGQANSCRGLGSVAGGDRYGDYECRDWSKLSVGGVLVAKSPVCEWGDALQCNGAGLVGRYQTTAFDCSIFGAQCRALDGSQITQNTKVGFCLDSTTSGP